MKSNRIILIAFCLALSLNLFAKEEIKLTWQATPTSYGDGFNYDKYITIIAPLDKTYTIDWGDGSAVETKTGTGSEQIIKYTHADREKQTVYISSSDDNCLFTLFNCTHTGISSLDLGVNKSLKSLSCNMNYLTELDISHCTALEYLDCSYNSLTELDISANSALKYLDCKSNDSWVNMQGSGNGISYLDFSNCELTYLNCSYNSLPLSNLYIASEMIDELENKILDHQSLPRRKVVIGTPIDFSSEIEFGGIATVFHIISDCNNILAVEDIDYTFNEGIITFLKRNLCNSGYILTMTNEAIPSASVINSFRVYDAMHLLSDLTVSEGILNPEFNSLVFNYTVNVDKDVSEISISATPNNPNTIISGTGIKTLNFGENNFTVNALTWSSQNGGSSHDYIIKVIRGTIGITDKPSSKIKIYPNPAKHFVEIDFGDNFMDFQSLKVYDLIGKLCLTVAITQKMHQVDIQNMPVGNYIIQVTGKDKLQVTEKLIITR